MRGDSVRFLLFGCCWVLAAVQAITHYNCKNDRRFLAFNICIVEYVNLDSDEDHRFPNVTHLEFRNGQFKSIGVDFFLSIGDMKRLTFRNGFLKDIRFWSPVLEELRVVNTELVEFDVLSEPNDSLKQLAIRSKFYSKWSPQMRLLKALEVIDIGYCNFTHLNLDWFTGYRNLRVLDVSKNRLHALFSGPHLKLQALEELYLYGNRFEYLWRFPDAFPSLKFVSLSENKWICSWVSMARDALFVLNMVLMDSDVDCEHGWISIGGICCRQTGYSKTVRTVNRVKVLKDETVAQNRQLEILLGNGSREGVQMAIGAKVDGNTVFVDKLMPVVLT
ncbi:uncharacterized protein LOC129733234 [Wyeomyia smithii]|uniref:uncharacterized protein LOC129733234 n=1 Tax=Wyeomyia smithii TaxID=174621 RepID=UPI0024682245|nr:uncharacterized protein LOC129733234 [Wyeomyia smithii]